MADQPAHVRWVNGDNILDAEVANGFVVVFVPRGLPGEYRVNAARHLNGEIGLETLADGVVTTICGGVPDMLAALWIRASSQLCVQEPQRLAYTLAGLFEGHPELARLFMLESARRLKPQGDPDVAQA